VIYAAAVHPPRRALLVFLAVAAGLAAPMWYDGWSPPLAAEDAAALVMWFTLGVVTMMFAASVKLDRITLQAGREEATRLARRDPLTGLGNRRAFDETLARVVTGGRRADRPLSLVISDIEGFKAVNDLHGHMEGDRCLRDVARALAASVRPGDDCFRWGGDEFAFILPGADRARSQVVVERVARAVGELRPPPGERPLRMRFGVAEIAPGMDAAALVAAADGALLASGHSASGRSG
jgi:diguanylate cyclase (GGDEF)-like protein